MKQPLRQTKRYLASSDKMSTVKSCVENLEFLSRFAKDTFELFRKGQNDSVAKPFNPEN